MLSIKGERNPDGSFDWANALIDAGLLSALTFFTNIAGKLALVTPIVFYEALVQAIIQFFAFLALKRGLVKPVEKGAKRLLDFGCRKCPKENPFKLLGLLR